MKIILIEQARTRMRWEARYDSAGFERALVEERDCSAAESDVRRADASAYRVYTGTSRASRQTAELLFELPVPAEATPLLDDVPISAFRQTEKPLPLWLWKAMAEVQWRSGGGRQTEAKADTERRVGQLADRLEAEEKDCILICRGLTMTALKAVLRRRGFLIEGGGLISRPLDRVRATKRSLHCGGCNHNCLLSEAKCDIGRAKAKAQGI